MGVLGPTILIILFATNNFILPILAQYQPIKHETHDQDQSFLSVPAVNIPGNFIASGFPPNTHVGILIDKNSSLSVPPPNPIRIIYNDGT